MPMFCVLRQLRHTSRAHDIGRERQYARFDSPHGELGVTARRDGKEFAARIDTREGVRSMKARASLALHADRWMCERFHSLRGA